MKLSGVDRRVSEEMPGLAKELNEALKDITGQTMGFSLIVYNSEPGARANYVSNCPRDAIIPALKTLINCWERGMPDIPAHKLDS